MGWDGARDPDCKSINEHGMASDALNVETAASVGFQVEELVGPFIGMAGNTLDPPCEFISDKKQTPRLLFEDDPKLFHGAIREQEAVQGGLWARTGAFWTWGWLIAGLDGGPDSLRSPSPSFATSALTRQPTGSALAVSRRSRSTERSDPSTAPTAGNLLEKRFPMRPPRPRACQSAVSAPE